MLRIYGTSAFRSLEGMIFPRISHVDICGIYHPSPMRAPIFPNAVGVSVRNCDKNFVYYHIDANHFPRAEALWLDAHPCEKSTVYNFPRVYLMNHYYMHYLDRWWCTDNKNIQPITPQDMLNYLNNLEKMGRE